MSENLTQAAPTQVHDPVGNPIELARPSIRRLKPYLSARSLTSEGRIFLDANESPVGAYSRYPQPQPPLLVKRLCQLYGVATQNLIVGRGSDEAIDLLTRTFCEPERDAIVVLPPTYGVYEVAADIQNASVTAIPLQNTNDGWTLNINALRAHFELQSSPEQKRTKIVYVCSPNNPTGTAFPLTDIEALAELTLGKSLLVVDEAYAEFSQAPSALKLLAKYPHLVILRTLSKAWAMAALRCGVAIASPEIIALLQKVRAPYPLPLPVIQLAEAALDASGIEAMHARVTQIVSERQRMSEELKKLDCVEHVYPSDANFLLVRFQDENLILNACRDLGIVVRNRAPEILKSVRITIGTPVENDQLLRTLQNVRSR